MGLPETVPRYVTHNSSAWFDKLRSDPRWSSAEKERRWSSVNLPSHADSVSLWDAEENEGPCIIQLI